MVNVVTINYNLSSETIPCVRSVLASEYKDISVYLVDNGSDTDDYYKLLNEFRDSPRVKVILIETNCGYVGGVNFGIKNALADDPSYILIMNNDTIIDKHAVGEMVNAAKRHNDRAIVSGKVYYYDHPDILQHTGVIFKDQKFLTTIYPGKKEKDVGQYDKELERDSLDDVFWILPAGIVKDVGYYCNYFFLYAEQGDYAQRARRKGYKLIYTPKAKIWHKESMTAGGGDAAALPICYWRGQGIFIFQYRNLKAKYFILMMLKNFVKFSMMAMMKKKNERECAFARLRGYFWGFKWMFNKVPNQGFNPYMRS